jgi:hypothetical protein
MILFTVESVAVWATRVSNTNVSNRGSVSVFRYYSIGNTAGMYFNYLLTYSMEQSPS